MRANEGEKGEHASWELGGEILQNLKNLMPS